MNMQQKINRIMVGGTLPESELPILAGSPKQVSWARSIRAKMLTKATDETTVYQILDCVLSEAFIECRELKSPEPYFEDHDKLSEDDINYIDQYIEELSREYNANKKKEKETQ